MKLIPCSLVGPRDITLACHFPFQASKILHLGCETLHLGSEAFSHIVLNKLNASFSFYELKFWILKLKRCFYYYE